uniref:Uncharacterized protein n=1 Tax=Panstrongylus lignarius TaxID=156445 RepID=A0A224Y414_9HEMI
MNWAIFDTVSLNLFPFLLPANFLLGKMVFAFFSVETDRSYWRWWMLVWKIKDGTKSNRLGLRVATSSVLSSIGSLLWPSSILPIAAYTC